MSATVSSGLVSAANNLSDARDKAGDASNYTDASRAIIAGLAGAGALYNIAIKNAPIGTASLGVGLKWNKDKDTDFSSTPVTTNIRAGNNVTIEAKSGNLTSVGSQISAGFNADGSAAGQGNITLAAGGNINLSTSIYRFFSFLIVE